MHPDELQRDEFSYFDDRDKHKRRINNENFQEDVNYAIELNRRIASFIGIWPLANTRNAEQTFKTLLKRCQNIIVYFLLSFLLVPGILHITLEERTLKRKMLKVRLLYNLLNLISY